MYAVAIGRCVGLFRAKDRAQTAVRGFSRGEAKKFDNEAAALDFLARRNIHEPVRRYWTEAFDVSALVQSPGEALRKRVCFPVGFPRDFYDESSHGTVVDVRQQDATWIWRVKMDNGYMDKHVEAWPLALGFEQEHVTPGTREEGPTSMYLLTPVRLARRSQKDAD